MIKYLLILLLSFTCLNAQVGEQLTPVATKSNYKSPIKSTGLNIITSSDTLQLPFVDDFSTNQLSVDIDDTTGYNYTSDTVYTRTFDGEFYDSYNTLKYGDTSYVYTHNGIGYDSVPQPVIEIIEFNYLVYPSVTLDTIYRFPNFEIRTNDLGITDTTYLTWNDTTWMADDKIYYVINESLGIWADNDAYINANYGVDCPTVGVATLDAVDQFGALHPGAGDELFYGDFLTSKPIDLSSLTPADSLYLSFYYQPEGLGDRPNTSDSLILEFNNGSGNWDWIWSSEGNDLDDTPNGTNYQFFHVMMPIADTTYFKSGFQFRFKVICTLAGSLEPSWAANADIWNLDYVILDKDRSWNDTIVSDVAFREKPRTLLNEFTAVPWPHYLNKNAAILVDSTFNMVLNNSNDPTPKNTAYQFTIDHQGSNLMTSTEYAVNLNPLTEFDFFGDLEAFDFVSSNTDSAIFSVTHFITTDQNDLKLNDTLHYSQQFYNYYAYDDGSAEAGYGVNSEGAMVALKFQPITDEVDTLQAVQFYFNQVAGNANINSFKISVWNTNSTGKPATLLYQSDLVSPQYSDSLNGFITYKLDTTVLINGEFCVGWEQFHDESLNLGFDRNSAPSQKLYYKILNTSGWQASSFSGAPMIRPVLGKPLPSDVSIPQIAYSQEVKVYPNPTKDFFYIHSTSSNECTYRVFDLAGKLISNGSFVSQIQLSSSQWNSGLYFVQIVDGKQIETRKIIIEK